MLSFSWLHKSLLLWLFFCVPQFVGQLDQGTPVWELYRSLRQEKFDKNTQAHQCTWAQRLSLIKYQCHSRRSTWRFRGPSNY